MALSIFKWQRPRIPASEIGPIQGPMPDSVLRPSAPAPTYRRGPFSGSEFYDREIGEDRGPAPAAGPARGPGGFGGGGGGINIGQTIANILGAAWNAIGRPLAGAAIATGVPIVGRPLAAILPAVKVGTVIARVPITPPAGAVDRAGAPELVSPGGDSAARNALAADLLAKHGGNTAAAAREYNDLVHGTDREYSEIVGADPRDWPEGTPGR